MLYDEIKTNAYAYRQLRIISFIQLLHDRKSHMWRLKTQIENEELTQKRLVQILDQAGCCACINDDGTNHFRVVS